MSLSKFKLIDKLGGSPDTNGCWYITAATNYDGDLLVSADGVTYVELTLAVGDRVESIPDGISGDGIYVDFTGETLTSITFVYITGCIEEEEYSPSLCIIDCIECKTVEFKPLAELTIDLTVTLLQGLTVPLDDCFFDLTFLAKFANGTPMSNGDLIRLEIVSLGIDVELIVGQNPTLPAGYQNDIGDNWAAFVPYLTASTMSAFLLLAGSYKIRFNKRQWALDTDHYNTYDEITGDQILNNATDLYVTVTAFSNSYQMYSNIDSEYIYEVRVMAFEDTSTPDYFIKPKGVGTWAEVADMVPSEDCSADCVPSKVSSWYSQKQGACVTKVTIPPSMIVEYETDYLGVVASALPVSNEASFIAMINTTGNFYFRYVPCSYAALAVFGVKGFNGSYLVTAYMTEAHDIFLNLKLKYLNNTVNHNKESTLVADMITLF